MNIWKIALLGCVILGTGAPLASAVAQPWDGGRGYGRHDDRRYDRRYDRRDDRRSDRGRSDDRRGDDRRGEDRAQEARRQQEARGNGRGGASQVPEGLRPLMFDQRR